MMLKNLKRGAALHPNRSRMSRLSLPAEQQRMRVTVFGIGYVGLVQAAVLAEMGHKVICVDVDADKVAALKAGHIPLFEPGLALWCCAIIRPAA